MRCWLALVWMGAAAVAAPLGAGKLPPLVPGQKSDATFPPVAKGDAGGSDSHVLPGTAPAAEPDAAGDLPRFDPPYTGLVVDCRGLGAQRARAPHLVLADGTSIWGFMAVDPDELNERGLVGYLATPEQALQPGCRSGSRPLFVRAVAVAGSGRCNAVLSAEDAERVARESARNQFIDGLRVVFLVD